MPLADPDDPFFTTIGKLVTSDGQRTNAEMGIEEYVSRNPVPLFRKFNPGREVGLDRTPEKDGKTQAGICAVVALRIMGLSIDDIAKLMGVTAHEIQDVVTMPATQRTFEMMFRGIINNNATTVQGKIAAYADRAVDTVVDLMSDEEVRDDVRLKAAQDILDRSGTHPDQFFAETEQQTQQDDELRITLLTEDTPSRVEVSIKRNR